MIPKSYFIIAANILKKPCTMMVTTKLNTDNYKNIVNIWKRYRFFNKLPIIVLTVVLPELPVIAINLAADKLRLVLAN